MGQGNTRSKKNTYILPDDFVKAIAKRVILDSPDFSLLEKIHAHVAFSNATTDVPFHVDSIKQTSPEQITVNVTVPLYTTERTIEGTIKISPPDR